VWIFGEVERQNRNRELQFGRFSDRPNRHQRVIGVLGEVFLGRVILGGDIDRDAIGGAIELAREERLVVGRIVPGRDTGNKIVGQRFAIFQRLHGLRRVDDDLVVLVDGIGAVTPQDPVQPSVGVAGGVPKREAGRGVVLLQRLAHFKEDRK